MKITIKRKVLEDDLASLKEKLDKELSHTMRAYYRGRIDSIEKILGFRTDPGFTEKTISQSE